MERMEAVGTIGRICFGITELSMETSGERGLLGS